MSAAAIRADTAAGMAWWNAIDENDRRFWMLASMGQSAADAWSYFKRCNAAGITSSAALATESTNQEANHG